MLYRGLGFSFLMSQELELMTGTTVGIRAVDGVVLAAEKRVSYGFYLMSRSGRKVFKITDNLGIASTGILADMQVITKLARTYLAMYAMDTKSKPTIRSAAKLISLILFQSRFLPYYVELLVGGIDEEGPHIFAMDPVGSLIEDDYTAAGTGARMAIAVIESNYRKDMSVGEARDLAIKAIVQAIARDPVSGDGIDILTITRNTAREETVPLAPAIRP